jgi:hypothetical protein
MRTWASPLNLHEAKALADKFALGFEGTPAAQPACELTDEDLRVIEPRAAVVTCAADEDDVHALRCKGAL